jgi:hypothetical protein
VKRRGKMRCPYCGSSRTIRAGKKRNKYVTKQGYRCKDCRRFFVERDGFENRTYPGERALVPHLYVEGLSLSKIREIVDQHHGYRSADSNRRDWNPLPELSAARPDVQLWVASLRDNKTCVAHSKHKMGRCYTYIHGIQGYSLF